MSRVDLDELERLAKEADPGPWRTEEDAEHYPFLVAETPDGGSYVLIESKGELESVNAYFMAAANPATALALVAELRAAREVVEASRPATVAARSGKSWFVELAKLLVAIEVYDQAVAP
jgi:hypothetical protein